MTVFAARPFGTRSRIVSQSNHEFYPSKTYSERKFLLGVSIKVTGDLRNVSILADFRDQRRFIDRDRNYSALQIKMVSVSINSYVIDTRK